MAKHMASKADAVGLLKHLIELDLDAMEAYDAALARVDDPALNEPLADFRHDHERHVRELSEAVRALGDRPPTQPDAKGLLRKGRVAIARLAGDHAILNAMRHNVEEVADAYGKAAGMSELEDDVHEIVAVGVADEQRHEAWLDAKLRTL